MELEERGEKAGKVTMEVGIAQNLVQLRRLARGKELESLRLRIQGIQQTQHNAGNHCSWAVRSYRWST